jgi:hypothetical protein
LQLQLLAVSIFFCANPLGASDFVPGTMRYGVYGSAVGHQGFCVKCFFFVQATWIGIHELAVAAQVKLISMI